MLEILLGNGKKAPAAVSPEWHSVSQRASINGDTVTFTETRDPTTGVVQQQCAAFGVLLPDQSCYFDMELSSGYQDNYMRIGIALGSLTSENWDYYLHNPGKAVWREDGIWSEPGNNMMAPDNLRAGVYRFAINKQTNKIFMKRMSPGETSIVMGNIDAYAGQRLRPFAMTEWVVTPLTLKLLKIEAGSGGLY